VDLSNKGEKKKRDDKPLVCYNCCGKGHTSRQCPSEALYCGAKSHRKCSMCQGRVDGQFVSDIVLDTGCTRTLVHRDLVGEESW